MAWNVVIAGGGFGGAMAARELERIVPQQSTRLTLVNDVNFMLYTPFLPEAAAGTLEPRHVVTPLREILDRTYLRLGAIVGHDPGARTVELRTREGDDEDLPYDQLLLALGSVSRVLPVPGLAEHAIGFKSLADAIWLRNHVVETLEAANATDDPAPTRRAAHLRLRRRRLRRPRGARRAAGLRRRRDRVLPARPPARDALDPGRGGRPGAARDRRRARRLRAARAARARHRHPPRHHPGGGRAPTRARLSTGETLPTRTVVWTAGVAPNPSLRQLSVPLDERGRVPVDDHLRVQGHGRRSGRSATAPPAARPARRRSARRPRSTRSARDRSPPATSPPSSASARPEPFEYRGNAAFVNLGRYKAVGRVGGRTFRGFPAWWLARTYHMSQIPGAARKARAVIDWTASLPFRRDLSEVGSIGHPKPLARDNGAVGFEYLVIAFFFGLATAIIGRAKGSSFWIWLLVGMVAAAARPDRGDPLPAREGRTRTPVPELPQGGEALRPGLPALRHWTSILPDPAEVRHPGVR